MQNDLDAKLNKVVVVLIGIADIYVMCIMTGQMPSPVSSVVEH